MMFRKHRHHRKPVAVSYIVIGVAQALGFGNADLPRTVILFRCDVVIGPDCVESKTVTGRWTEHDLDIIPATWPDELKGPDESAERFQATADRLREPIYPDGPPPTLDQFLHQGGFPERSEQWREDVAAAADAVLNAPVQDGPVTYYPSGQAIVDDRSPEELLRDTQLYALCEVCGRPRLTRTTGNMILLTCPEGHGDGGR